MRTAYKNLREEFAKSLRIDLIGPYQEDEEIYESPTTSYIMGRLGPIDKNNVIDSENEISNTHNEADPLEDDGDETNDIDDKFDVSEDIHISKNKQSSAGLKIFLSNETDIITAKIKWADYLHIEGKNEDSKQHSFKRFSKFFSETIDVSNGNIDGIMLENGIFLSWLTHKLKNKNKMVSIYVENRRAESTDVVKNHIFQVELCLESEDGSEVFLSETLAYDKFEADDYFYNKKPIFSRGYGCAATWDGIIGHTARTVKTDFLPSQELNGMDAELSKFKDLFSMFAYSKAENHDSTLGELADLLNDYATWIERLKTHEYMKDMNYIEYGNEKIRLSSENLERMSEGLNILRENKEAFTAFLYMNKAMLLSRSMGEFSKQSTSEGTNKLEDFIYDHSFWRPFQIGFILLNIKSIVDPTSKDRNILDLLYFPTGGGKTEAYLGVISFLIFFRRLTRESCDYFEKDGGVTVIVRYTLRLLTTQQRDRMLRLISACEILRNDDKKSFGYKEFSIGFWVGGTVTINKYSELIVDKYNKKYQVDTKKRSLRGQILKCPCCGKDLSSKSYVLDIENKKYEIYCSTDNCYFVHRPIPVYLIDEDIYSKTPTVIIGTVDKFARITFEERVHLLFGRREMECTDCGSMLTSEEDKIKSCTEKGHVRTNVNINLRPFFPPELILQDELHLITGPLGTIYGSYEMAINELATSRVGNDIIQPKYIASTATIKNADKQILSLYARTEFNQFPPNGHDSNDSYFAKEKKIEEYPFRLYVGVSSPYTSMKTTILRVYAVLLQTAERYKDDPVYREFIDPYWTLIGYYNSKRELGGAVRLIQDDIPDRTMVLQKKNGDTRARKYFKYDEITSRTKSYDIPKVLNKLENSYGSGTTPYDVVVATNMIQVGMDVERLGLMAVTGQPKTTAEYIQATSRIGRTTPGLVVTIYNAYRSRDLSHYENFTAYHAHLYRYVEGNSATPFSARARERSLHAAFIAILRGEYEKLRDTKTGARKIGELPSTEFDKVIQVIKDRIKIVDPNNRVKAIDEIRYFYDEWLKLARTNKNLYYYVHPLNLGYKTKKIQRLLKAYGENGLNHEKDTLNSMRNVQKEVGLYLWED